MSEPISQSPHQPKRIQTYKEFWPFYLSQHNHPATKQWHAIGLISGLCILLAGLLVGSPVAVALALVVGYGFAWWSHWKIEKNRPATFEYPWWSFVSDFRMTYFWIKSFF